MDSSSNNILALGSSWINQIAVESLFAFAFWLPLASLSKEWEAFEKQSLYFCAVIS